MRRFAFTLSELLIALLVVGIVAVLTVPNVTKNVYKRTNVARIETTMKTLNDAVRNMLVNEHVSSVADSSLIDDPSVFFTKYLKTTKLCSDDVLECFQPSFKTIDGKRKIDFGKDATLSPSYAAVLPSGVVVAFENVVHGPLSGSVSNYLCSFYIDINGKDAPNTIGRDFFTLFLSESGNVGTFEHYDTPEEVCLSGSVFYGNSCVSILQQNNWIMDY